MRRRRLLITTLASLLAVTLLDLQPMTGGSGGALGARPARAAASPGDGGFVAVPAATLLDAAMTSGETRTIAVAGRHGVPSPGEVATIRLRVLVKDPPGGGGTVQPAGSPRADEVVLHPSLPGTAAFWTASASLSERGEVTVRARGAVRATVSLDGYVRRPASAAAAPDDLVTANTILRMSPVSVGRWNLAGFESSYMLSTDIFSNYTTARPYSITWVRPAETPNPSNPNLCHTTVNPGYAIPASPDGTLVAEHQFYGIAWNGPASAVCNTPASLSATATVNLSGGQQLSSSGSGNWTTAPAIATGSPPPLPGGQALGGGGPTGSQADPVISLTGAFVHSERDLTMPTRGFDLQFTRTYNSNDATVGPLGRGWSHTYSQSLTVAGSDVTYRSGTGRQEHFTRNANGSYTPDVGVRTTLTRAGDGTYTLTTPDQTRLLFSSAGRLTNIRDRNDQGLDLNYDVDGRLGWVQGADRSLDLVYDASGMLASVGLVGTSRRSANRWVNFAYTSGRLASVQKQSGATIAYQYDAGNRLSSIRNTASASPDMQIHYDGSGRVDYQIDANGKRSNWTWDPATTTATMTSPRGGRWVDRYANGYLVKRVDPNGSTVLYDWDERGLLRSVSDALGNITRFDYDARGNLLRRTSPTGATETSTYNTRNDLTATTDLNGHRTTYGYDARGNLTRVERVATAAVHQYTYDTVGNRVTATDPRGKITRFEYSASGDRTAVTDPVGRKTTATYDIYGRMTAVTDPRGNLPGATGNWQTTYSYDAADRLLQVTGPYGPLSSSAYDAYDRRTTSTDGRGNATTFGYDQAGNVTSVQGPDTLIPPLRFTYDDDDNLATRRDARLAITTYSYDLAGQLTGTSGPAGAWSFGYDEAGRRTSSRAPSGRSVTFGYDDRGLLTRADYSDSTADVTYTYDPAGNRTSMQDGAGTVTYGYDGEDRLSTAARGTEQFSYAYDLAGNLTNRTFPGTVSTFTYDDAGRMTTAKRGAVTVASYAYDDTVGKVTATLGNGLVETRTTDRLGRLDSTKVEQGAATLFSAAYVRDADGNPLSITDAGGATTSYTYDQLSRLTAVCYQTTSCAGASDFIRYGYDGNDNRTTDTRPAGTTTYTYDAANRLTGRSGLGGSASYSHDADGNLLSNGTSTFAWNAAGRMTSSTSGGTTTSYAYDGDGRRLSASPAGGTAVGLLWDPLTYQLLWEKFGFAITRIYDYGRSLVDIRDGGVPIFYSTDELGSTRLITNNNAAVQWRYEFEPYGATRVATKVDPNAKANSTLFTGAYTDPNNQVHLRARQYDPAAGVFTSPDPAGTAPLYGYANANPMVFVDPLGLYGWRDFVHDLNQVSGWVATGAGVAALACGATVVCAPAAAVLGTIAGTAAAVNAASGAVIAIDRCVSGKGSCLGAVVGAAVAASAGRYRLPTQAAVVRGGATPVRVGQQGVERLGITPNTRRILLPNNRYRVPDILDSEQRVIGEVKNVAKLSYTAQLRDYVSYAQANGLQFELYVRGGTKLSGPLQRAVDAGDITLHRGLPG